MEKDIIKLYIEFRADSGNDDLPDSHFCRLNGITADELDKIKQDNPELARKCLEARRTKYAEKIQEIDSALFTAAKAGDTRAAELIYRRFDGYDPKKLAEDRSISTFADLVKDIHKKAA